MNSERARVNSAVRDAAVETEARAVSEETEKQAKNIKGPRDMEIDQRAKRFADIGVWTEFYTTWRRIGDCIGTAKPGPVQRDRFARITR